MRLVLYSRDSFGIVPETSIQQIIDHIRTINDHDKNTDKILNGSVFMRKSSGSCLSLPPPAGHDEKY